MAEREYDEETCITAGELRAMGCDCGDIPDCAWVPRLSVSFGEPDVQAKDKDARTLSVSVPVVISEPFRWISIDAVIPNG